jgi:hypothetical protein
MAGNSPGALTDPTANPHTRRNIQLQRTEFVPVRIMRQTLCDAEAERRQTY